MVNVSAVRPDGSEKSELREITLQTTAAKRPTPSLQQATQGAKRLLTGIVIGVNASVITILLSNQPDSFYTVRADLATVRGENNTPSAIADVLLGQRIAAVGSLEGENTMRANLIHILANQ